MGIYNIYIYVLDNVRDQRLSRISMMLGFIAKIRQIPVTLIPRFFC